MEEENDEQKKINVGSIRDLSKLPDEEPRKNSRNTADEAATETRPKKPQRTGIIGFILRFYKRFTYEDLVNESTWSLAEVSVVSEVGSIQSDVETRGKWGRRIEFLLSCIGYAVGLGNVWRFPFKVMAGGGGAFLIPYLIMLISTALPILFLEMGVGQFSSLGPTASWNMCPLFRGVGYSTVVICTLVCIYYNVIVAWSFMYIGYIFLPKMPWDTCDNEWNDAFCVEPSSQWPNNKSAQMSADQFWERKVLGRITKDGKTLGMEGGLGKLEWPQAVSLFVAWILVGAIILKGPKTSGKAAYVTATAPYVLIFVFIGIGTGLPGARDGLKYLFYPSFSKLANIQTWRIATEQIFYSLGIGFGSFVSLASYNDFNANIYRDTFVIASINSFTSVFAGVSVFQMIGFIAHRTNQTVEELSGTLSSHGLIFVAYAEGLSHATGKQYFTFLFFLLILFLGVDSQIGLLETVITSIKDELVTLIDTKLKKMMVSVIVCCVMFLIGLSMMANGGIYYFNMVDSTSASYSLMMVSIFEVIAVFYCYGLNKFINDIYMMLHLNVGPYWKFSWGFTAPLVIFIIFIWSAIDQGGLSYGINERLYIYPSWANSLGWLVCVSSFIAIPIYAIYYLVMLNIKHPTKGIVEILKLSLAETDEWGPSLSSNWLLSKRYRDKVRQLKSKCVEAPDPAVIE